MLIYHNPTVSYIWNEVLKFGFFIIFDSMWTKTVSEMTNYGPLFLTYVKSVDGIPSPTLSKKLSSARYSLAAQILLIEKFFMYISSQKNLLTL